MEEPILDIHEIQANISPGFKMPFQAFIGINGENNLLIDVLKLLKPSITTMHEALIFHKKRTRIANKKQFGISSFKSDNIEESLWINIALSNLFFHSIDHLHKFKNNESFKIGCYGRSFHIGDTKDKNNSGHRDNWIFGNPLNRVSVLIILGSNSETILKAKVDELESSYKDIIVYKQFGKRLENDIEHFGFKDGISQPKLRGYIDKNRQFYLSNREMPNSEDGPEYASPGSPLIWPGEFILGYPKQNPNDYRLPMPTLNSEIDEDIRNGSFLVFRRLNQDVGKFYKDLDALSEKLAENEAFKHYNGDLLRSKIVGRTKSGIPLVRENEIGEPFDSKVHNHFLYKERASDIVLDTGIAVSGCENDRYGHKCPMFGHIRKVNPRDVSTDQGSATNTMKIRILRRGIPFGQEYDFSNHNNIDNQEERGLLFLCYQSNIERQFETLMNRWVNTPINPEENKGFDILIGNNNASRDEKIFFKLENDLGKKQLDTINKWVEATGGEYLFSPSISYLNKIVTTPNIV